MTQLAVQRKVLGKFLRLVQAEVREQVISCERCAIDSGRALTTLARSQSELKILNETAQGDHDHSQTFQSNGAHQGGPALQP
ncbi:hypothetical protein [Mesorhizobium sp. f-mel]